MVQNTITIKTRLKNINPEQSKLLTSMMQQYTKACNFVSDYIFNHGFELNSNTLSKILYYDVKNQFNLKSQLTANVFRTVTARYKTVKTQLSQRPFKYHDDENDKWLTVKRDLQWLHKPIQFKRLQADLVRTRDYSFVNNKSGKQLSLQTLAKGRIKVDFSMKGFEKYLNHQEFTFGTSKLVKINGKWFFHMSITFESADFDKSQLKHVVGIDRGLNFLATVFDEQQKTQFFNGREIINKRNQFALKRKQLQQKGTASARRRLKAIGQKENRWMNDVNHRITKTLLDHYGSDTLFVIEDLTNITFDITTLRKSQHSKFKSWAFYQFEQFLTYKAQMNQSEVVKIDAHYTSQRCPHCGIINKNNRKHDTHEYVCDNCGYRSNDDRLGAMNIYELGKQYVTGVEKPTFTKLRNLEK